MQAFDITHAGDFSDWAMTTVRNALNTAKEGKPYACIQYHGIETVTYWIPEVGESVDHLIARIDTMVMADPQIQTATVMNAQSHLLWMVDRTAAPGYLLKQTTRQACPGYTCWACGHQTLITFHNCPTCSMENTCQPSTLRWIHAWRMDRAPRCEHAASLCANIR
ncbi:hypothetical protein [Herpetosiphon geysericola]|uniref:Uncharacterized protein n=1 Tax=Herpetosiphon geysericola TaxID=70996 RepID=A0A0P6YDB8_9CHLR|nr:hypothetical protein [Herpetosiphon geysericola]KPL87531.1 hypothetical protein SE18_10700 [Herpetosiphon geysericola]